MKKKLHWRLWLLRWHRRIGVLLSVFLLWMVISGVLLNHSDDFHLDQQVISSKILLNGYNVQPTGNPIIIADKTLSLSKSGLYLAQQNLGDCSTLLGVMRLKDLIVVACPQHLLLLTNTGELIDQSDSLHGLQQTFTAANQQNNEVFLQVNETTYRLNTDDLSLSLSTIRPNTWLKPIEPSVRISIERWLLDAHSGRIFGGLGKWFVDAFALVLIVLVLSGWALAKKRHQRML